MKKNFSFQRAKWIWINETKIDQYADFYTEFEYLGGDAKLYISAKTDYLVYINDNFLGCGQYADFPELKSVDVLSITDSLRYGKNKIFIIARSMDQDTFCHIKSGHGVIFELCVEGNPILCSNEKILSRKSCQYESGPKYTISFQISFGYVCNLQGEEGNWSTSKIVDGTEAFFLRPIAKLKQREVDEADRIVCGAYRLSEDGDISERLQYAFLSHKDVVADELFAQEKDDGVYFIVDLKKENSGFVTFDIEMDEPADIIVAFGEHLNDLRVRHKIGSRNFLLFHKGKKGRNIFTGYLRRIGCRYLQFFVASKHIKINKATLIETLYPLKLKEKHIEDFLLRNIYDVSVNTLRQCMHEHYEDCPWREQSQYAGDSFLQIISGFYAFENQEFAKASLSLMGHELNAKGFLSLTSPARCDGSRCTGFIPIFSLNYILAVCFFCEHTKDWSFFEENKETVCALLNSFIKYIDETGLIKCIDAWNFYEWTDNLDSRLVIADSYHAPLNAMFLLCLTKVCSLLEKSGNKEKAKSYEPIHKKSKSVFDEYFWDEKKQAYATYCIAGKKEHYAEYTQSVVVWSGLCGKKRAEELCKKLSSKNDWTKASLASYFYKYSALLDTSTEYKSYILEDIKMRWGRMLFAGATSFWETEEGERAFSKAGSLCHGWSAIPIYFFEHYALI